MTAGVTFCLPTQYWMKWAFVFEESDEMRYTRLLDYGAAVIMMMMMQKEKNKVVVVVVDRTSANISYGNIVS